MGTPIIDDVQNAVAEDLDGDNDDDRCYGNENINDTSDKITDGEAKAPRSWKIGFTGFVDSVNYENERKRKPMKKEAVKMLHYCTIFNSLCLEGLFPLVNMEILKYLYSLEDFDSQSVSQSPTPPTITKEYDRLPQCTDPSQTHLPLPAPGLPLVVAMQERSLP